MHKMSESSAGGRPTSLPPSHAPAHAQYCQAPTTSEEIPDPFGRAPAALRATERGFDKTVTVATETKQTNRRPHGSDLKAGSQRTQSHSYALSFAMRAARACRTATKNSASEGSSNLRAAARRSLARKVRIDAFAAYLTEGFQGARHYPSPFRRCWEYAKQTAWAKQSSAGP